MYSGIYHDFHISQCFCCLTVAVVKQELLALMKHQSLPLILVAFVLLNLYFFVSCFVYQSLTFCLFSVGHYIVCPLMYSFWSSNCLTTRSNLVKYTQKPTTLYFVLALYKTITFLIALVLHFIISLSLDIGEGLYFFFIIHFYPSIDMGHFPMINSLL